MKPTPTLSDADLLTLADLAGEAAAYAAELIANARPEDVEHKAHHGSLAAQAYGGVVVVDRGITSAGARRDWLGRQFGKRDDAKGFIAVV